MMPEGPGMADKRKGNSPLWIRTTTDRTTSILPNNGKVLKTTGYTSKKGSKKLTCSMVVILRSNSCYVAKSDD